MHYVWMIVALFAGLLGAAGGVYLSTFVLRRAVREVQYGLADLEDRLVREVKKRAAAARWEEPPAEETITEGVKAGFLSPAAFARRKSERRLSRGSQAGPFTQEGS